MLFEMARALRSLTRSPITSALHEARRIARPHFHFEEGGVVPHEARVEDHDNEGGFLLPPDVDPMAVALAIDEKLRDGRTAAGLGDDPMRRLERRARRADRGRRSSLAAAWTWPFRSRPAVHGCPDKSNANLN